MAPIFELGDGRYGEITEWRAVPFVVDEEDAIQIIREELAAAGVNFSQQNVELRAVRVPPRQRYDKRRWFGMGRKYKTVTVVRKSMARPLVLDLVDPDTKIGIEYISRRDYIDAGGIACVERYGSFGSCAWDFKDAARYLADQVRTQATGLRVGIFYDPTFLPPSEWHAEWQAEWEQIVRRLPANSPDAFLAEQAREARRDFQQRWEERARRESAAPLRLQVKDFVDWLKAQGVI